MTSAKWCSLCNTFGAHAPSCTNQCPHDNADLIGADPANRDPVYRCLDCGLTFVVRRFVNDLEESYAEEPDIEDFTNKTVTTHADLPITGERPRDAGTSGAAT